MVFMDTSDDFFGFFFFHSCVPDEFVTIVSTLFISTYWS